MKRIVNTRPYLYLELSALMVGLPLLLSTVLPIRYMLPMLWAVTMYCHFVYRIIVDVPDRIYWRWPQVKRANMKPILLRFALCLVLASMLTALWKPTYFLSFVCERPAFWAFVMVAYPLVSVIPQEVIFRSFFFQRYTRIFTTPMTMVLASAVLFGAAHLIFQNWVAPLLCVIGGFFFAQTYQKTKSLALACIEHALYGCMIFTVGLGPYFYHGAVYSKFEDKKPSAACAFISERVEKIRSVVF